MRRCPHGGIRFCPLYIAMHVPGGPSCDDGLIHDGRCAVSRGMDYRRQVELLRVRRPGLVEQAEWDESAGQLRAQSQRNLRLNGIH